ncbi:MAG TPA: hypothetical protein VGG27_15580 [Magnetospirillaceae bacterium]|jgi:hypothetical protein
MSSLISSDTASSYFGTGGAKGSALGQQMKKLAHDTKSGNTSAAQKDSDALSQMMSSGGASSPFASMLSQAGGGMPMGNSQSAGASDFASGASMSSLSGASRAGYIGSALNIAA